MVSRSSRVKDSQIDLTHDGDHVTHWSTQTIPGVIQRRRMFLVHVVTQQFAFCKVTSPNVHVCQNRRLQRVMEAASVMQESAVFATSEAMRQADLRLSSLKAEHNFPSGMVDFLNEDEEMALRGMPGAVEQSSDVESVSSSASSDSEDEEECEFSHALIDDVHNEGQRAIPSPCSDTMLAYRHNRPKMVHHGHVEHSDKTGCGRMLSYYRVGDVDKVFPKCKVCFGHVQV